MRKFKPGEIIPVDISWEWQLFWKSWHFGTQTFVEADYDHFIIDRTKVWAFGPLQIKRVQRAKF